MKLVCVLVLVFGGLAAAETQAEIAEKTNQQGIDLMMSSKYAEAADKFRDAATRAPQAKYFFNLCTALYQQGVFGAALSACDAVSHNQPTRELQTKTDKLSQKIKEDAKAQNIKLEPVAAPKPSDLAAKSNQEGKDLMYAGKYADAVVKFRDAVAHDPLAAYYFNLCSATYQIGHFGEALEACKAVAKHNPTADIQSKSIKLIVKIREDARNQKINLD
jgi:tetratricopeptide (TPR) repeat protein